MANREHVIKLPLSFGLPKIEDFVISLVDMGIRIMDMSNDGETFYLRIRGSKALADQIFATATSVLSKNPCGNPPREFAEKRFRRWGVSRRQARGMKHAELVAVIEELGWKPIQQVGTHIKYLNTWIPGYAPNLVHKPRGHNPGHVAGYSDAFGFTRLDLEGTFKKDVRILLFLERAIAAFPEHEEYIRKHYDSLRAKTLKDPHARREYDEARASIQIEHLLGPAPVKEKKETGVKLEEILDEVAEPEGALCPNCGKVGHIYEMCPLPWIFVIGWSKEEDDDGPWETTL